MLIMERWIDAESFATLLGVSVRHARRIFYAAARGEAHGGAYLSLRPIHGRGGRSGLRYEVALSSLSEDLQTRFSGALEPLPLYPNFDPDAPRLRPAKGQGAEIERKLMILSEALDYPFRSKERADALKRAAKVHGEPLRTLQGWMKRHDDHGGDANAFARKEPANAGKKRVAISRKFDKAYRAKGYDEALLPELRELLIERITGAMAGVPSRSGMPRVRLEAETAFRRDCRERGIVLPKAAFAIDDYHVASYREFAEVELRANDRKAFDDSAPRIRRDNSLWKPMQHVVMDVKPIDVVVRRPDGSTTYPRLIGFMDAGTHRLFAHIVFLNPGEGVRQEHVIAGFAAMCAHPEWGFPQTLQRDNGSEFKQFDLIRDLLKSINDPNVRTIVNAKPYAGSSKPIESLFSDLDNYLFSQMEGYVGGNRMNKKVQTVGKPVEPYSRGLNNFVEETQLRLLDFMGQKVLSGPFKDCIPLQVYADRINEWTGVRVDDAVIEEAFSTRVTRRVDRGALSIEGARWRHPQLPNRATLEIAIPYRRGARPLVNLPELGWAVLEPELLHVPWDVAGARDASRMRQADGRRVSTLKRKAGSIDLAANLADRVAELPTAPPARRPYRVRGNANLINFADARAVADQREAAALPEPGGITAAEDRLTKKLMKRYGL